MTFFPEGTMTPLARAVSAEIRATMAVHRTSGRTLAADAKFASHNYVAERLRDDKPFNLDDIERICLVFGQDAAEFIARAWDNHGRRLAREAEEANAEHLDYMADLLQRHSDALLPDESPEEGEAARVVERIDRHKRDTRPTRKRAMQQLQDEAARDEDTGA